MTHVGGAVVLSRVGGAALLSRVGVGFAEAGA